MIYNMVFSPTGGTLQVAELVMRAFQGPVTQIVAASTQKMKKVCDGRKANELFLRSF